MANVVTHFSVFFKVAFVCHLLSASVSSDDLFDSFRFTRDALAGFSSDVRSSMERTFGRSLTREKSTNFRPSNKHLHITNEIEKALVNAKAMDSRRLQHSASEEYITLTRLFRKSVENKSYTYARDVLGKLIYLLKTRPTKRRKRSSENTGTDFLRRLRNNLGSEKIDSFMAVEGGVALMFVVDDTGSMRDEIQAVKRIATAVVNYNRSGPVDYILSPFNDPMEGIVRSLYFTEFAKEVELEHIFCSSFQIPTQNSTSSCPDYIFFH